MAGMKPKKGMIQMIEKISQATIENNGIEFDHEMNEIVLTKGGAYISIPSDAHITQNKYDTGIVCIHKPGIIITLFPTAAMHITIMGGN